MKTNITMISESDRNLYGVTIRQNTKDCMLNLTDLQDAYTVARIQNKWSDKDIFNILKYEQNMERIYYILNEQGVFEDKEMSFTDFYETVKENGIVKVLKSLGVYKMSGRGENRTVYCNPYIWVLVAMELNPQMYAKVVMWLTDKLILNRIEAGNLQSDLAKALSQYIPSPEYGNVAIECNKRIFGKHENGIRNTRSQDELKELAHLEDNITFCIKKGYLKTNEEVLEAIRTY